MASAIARVYNRDLGGFAPVGSRAKPLVRRAKPPEADEIFVV